MLVGIHTDPVRLAILYRIAPCISLSTTRECHACIEREHRGHATKQNVVPEYHSFVDVVPLHLMCGWCRKVIKTKTAEPTSTRTHNRTRFCPSCQFSIRITRASKSCDKHSSAQNSIRSSLPQTESRLQIATRSGITPCECRSVIFVVYYSPQLN